MTVCPRYKWKSFPMTNSIVEQPPNNDQAPEVNPQDQPQEQTEYQSPTPASEIPEEYGLKTPNLNKTELLRTELIHFRPSISTSRNDLAPPDRPPPVTSEQSQLTSLPIGSSFNLPESQTAKRPRTPDLDEQTFSMSAMGISQAQPAFPDTPRHAMPELSRDPSDMENLPEPYSSTSPRKKPRISQPDTLGEA